MGTILVTGATGTLGRPLVARLLADGAAVRAMSRRPRPAGDDRACDWAVAELASGAGLADAVADVETIVHCATNLRDDTAATRRLVAAARAGAPHLVYISIVGVDRVPYFYYRGKLAAEQLIEASGLPFTILRTTQFHDLLARVTLAQRWLPAVLSPAGVRFQPIDVTEVAARLAVLAQNAPAGRVADMGGPQVRDAAAFARATLAAVGRRRPVVPVRLPGAAFRAFRDGGHLAPDQAVGTVTFERYLARRQENSS